MENLKTESAEFAVENYKKINSLDRKKQKTTRHRKVAVGRTKETNFLDFCKKGSN